MRSKNLSLDQYDTDKITFGYLKYYDRIFEPWVEREIKLLEIGIHKGGSLLLWRDYFPSGAIVGIDIDLPKDFSLMERINLFQGRQEDVEFLSEVANKSAPDGFDIIIDDGSHIGKLTKKTFWHLFDNHLRAGGLFVIEDWGTGYYNDWADGKTFKQKGMVLLETLSRLFSKFGLPSRMSIKVPFHSHSYGMVGFIKELVDEQGAADLTKGSLIGESTRQSKFESMLITPSIVFIRKSASWELEGEMQFS